MLKTFEYNKTHNLGDAIQYIAIRNLLKELPHKTVDRDNPIEDDFYNSFLGFGFLDSRWTPVDYYRNAFAGVHVADKTTALKFKNLGVLLTPIGARDYHTQRNLKSVGIESEFVGCPTLTFDKYTGPRSGVLHVDTGECHLTHKIGNISWEEQLKLAEEYLEKYKTAEEVHTSRLHVALPCVAFGTPVRLIVNWNDPRMSLAQGLGLRNRQILLNQESLKVKFKDFLKDCLERIVETE